MIKLADKPNVLAPTATYPYGKTTDNTGTNNGFPLSSATLEDYHQFFAKMFAESGIVANGLPDNATNGFQMYNAFRKLTRPYKLFAFKITQSGTAAPTVNVFFNDLGGTVVWTRTGVGTYEGTLVGAFAGNTAGVIPTQPASFSKDIRALVTSDKILLYTYSAGTAADTQMTADYIEVKVFD